MNKYNTFLLAFILGLLTLGTTNQIFAMEESKKILILTSAGGGGHLTASTSLEAQLKDSYQIETVNVFQDLLGPLDPIRSLTSNKYSLEEIYNYLVPAKNYNILTLFRDVGNWFMQHHHKEDIQQLLRNYFKKNNPDLIISVIPLINNIILDTAQELNIPFILMPTDLDITMYVTNIKNPTYKQFKICLPFDDEEIMTPLKNAGITKDHVAIVGPPLKPNFFEKKNIALLKSNLNIPENKPAIMILMGSQGLDDTEKYTAELIKLEQPAHLIICFGKNEASKEAIEKMTIPSHITISLVGFTTRIADYMAVSDLLITKSGTLSVCEAIYMNLPMLLDATSTILPWEWFNHMFIKKHHFGESITDYSMVVPLVSSLIYKDKIILDSYKNNLKTFKKPHNQQIMKELVRTML